MQMERVTTDAVVHESVNEAPVNHPVTASRERRGSQEANVADDTVQVQCSSSRNAVDDVDDDDDKIRQTKSSADTSRPTYRKNRRDNGIISVRRVTSDIRGTPVRHSTPIRTHHHHVIRETPTTVSAPNLSGID